MTLRALYGERAEGIQSRGYHIITIQMAGDFAVDFLFRNFCMADEIPGASSEEPRGNNAIYGLGIKGVSCKLLLDEAGIGFVFIEGANDVVP